MAELELKRYRFVIFEDDHIARAEVIQCAPYEFEEKCQAVLATNTDADKVEIWLAADRLHTCYRRDHTDGG